jgi:hypothetical protein
MAKLASVEPPVRPEMVVENRKVNRPQLSPLASAHAERQLRSISDLVLSIDRVDSAKDVSDSLGY